MKIDTLLIRIISEKPSPTRLILPIIICIIQPIAYYWFFNGDDVTTDECAKTGTADNNICERQRKKVLWIEKYIFIISQYIIISIVTALMLYTLIFRGDVFTNIGRNISSIQRTDDKSYSGLLASIGILLASIIFISIGFSVFSLITKRRMAAASWALLIVAAVTLMLTARQARSPLATALNFRDFDTNEETKYAHFKSAGPSEVSKTPE